MRAIYYYSQLNIGGAERSTIRLVNAMAQYGWDVTVLLRWDHGLLEHELLPEVKKIYLKHERRSRLFGKAGDLVWFVLQTLLCKIRERRLDRIDYDLAINGLLGYDPRLLLNRVKAKQYYQMLRNDVRLTGKYGKTQEYLEKFGTRFDYYIGVSRYTTKSFEDCYPALADRAVTVYNIIPEIDRNREWEPPKAYADDGALRILTVGRIEDKAKAVFRMVEVAARLVSDGFRNFRWYIVGEGGDKAALATRISEAGLENTVILCPGTSDPFPYYRYADLVAVLSYYEGLCGVVNEAKIMEKCVIATRFSGIDEQICPGVNGLIVENDTDAIVKGLKQLLESPQTIRQMSINGLSDELGNNRRKIEKLEELFAKAEQNKQKNGAAGNE